MIYLCLIALLFAHPAPVSAKTNTDDFFNFSKKQEDALIVKVNSADSIVLEDGRRIRLVGVESLGEPKRKYPKLDSKGMVIEEKEEVEIPIEEQSISFTQELLEGKKVKLEYDVDALDNAGRRQAYVFLADGRLANAELLRQGFVHMKISPPNVKYADQLRSAYREAKEQKRGLSSN